MTSKPPPDLTPDWPAPNALSFRGTALRWTLDRAHARVPVPARGQGHGTRASGTRVPARPRCPSTGIARATARPLGRRTSMDRSQPVRNRLCSSKRTPRMDNKTRCARQADPARWSLLRPSSFLCSRDVCSGLLCRGRRLVPRHPRTLPASTRFHRCEQVTR